MLSPFIIEQIRRREDAQRKKRDAERPRLEISVEEPLPRSQPPASERSERGVIVIDL